MDYGPLNKDSFHYPLIKAIENGANADPNWIEPTNGLYDAYDFLQLQLRLTQSPLIKYKSTKFIPLLDLLKKLG